MILCYKTCLLTFAASIAVLLCVPAIAQQSTNLISPDQAGSAPPPPPQQQATAAQTPSGS
jgi:hypothetical protein